VTNRSARHPPDAGAARAAVAPRRLPGSSHAGVANRSSHCRNPSPVAGAPSRCRPSRQR
jgi:hypothetical protein